MSNNNCILKSVNLEDNHIIFDDKFCDYEIINNAKHLVYYASLSYNPICCDNCGVTSGFVKNGFKLSIIKLPSVSGFKTIFKLNKQRFICRECNSSFIAKSTLVNDYSSVSNNTKYSIASSLKNKISMKDIAYNHNVSINTVTRVMNSFYHSFKPNLNFLPETLCFDEFKSTNGNMSFIFVDYSTHKAIDILEDRNYFTLYKYFIRYPKHVRDRVKSIVIDIYSPYMKVIKTLFKNASIIIDKFHMIQLLSRSLNKTRIKVMNEFKTDTLEYKLLKKQWRLLLKDSSSFNNNWFYNQQLDAHVTQYLLIEKLLAVSDVLKTSYNLYQSLLFAISSKNITSFVSIVETKHENISSFFKTSMNTLNKYLKYFINTLLYEYTNGVIEGINNLIKVIKRIAFGFKSFINFKTRILITCNILKQKEV